MTRTITIGLVVPTAEHKVPPEAPIMYPDVTFVARGVGVRALTPEGYEPAMAAILPAAERNDRQDCRSYTEARLFTLSTNCTVALEPIAAPFNVPVIVAVASDAVERNVAVYVPSP